jgi:AcrR family transcriptional regulator
VQPIRSARERLVAAAGELTYAHGITATGVDAIAARAGVTKRTLYQHFRSKDELVAASLVARDRPAIDALRAAVLRRSQRTSTPPALALFDVLERTLSGPGARGCAFLNASLELDQPAHPAVAAAQAHLHARRDLIAELLHASHIDDDQLVDALVLLVDGTFAVAASRGDPTIAQHARRTAERLLTTATPIASHKRE